MKVVLASDHRGYQLKASLRTLLAEIGIESIDVGTFSTDSTDYPDFGRLAAEKVSRGECDRGIVICGSGIGMSIVANKFPRVRAALCHDAYTARMSRQHNDSNVLALGADLVNEQAAREIVKVWLYTEFEGGRHLRRVEKVLDIEAAVAKKCD
jgi:ribose 5-phosphate isomerase B